MNDMRRDQSKDLEKVLESLREEELLEISDNHPDRKDQCIRLDRVFVAIGLEPHEKQHVDNCRYCQRRVKAFRKTPLELRRPIPVDKYQRQIPESAPKPVAAKFAWSVSFARREFRPLLRTAAVVFLALVLMNYFNTPRDGQSYSRMASLSGFLRYINPGFDSAHTFPERTAYLPPPQEETDGHTFVTPDTELAAQTKDEIGNRVYIFEDEPYEFVPVGWMPDGQGIAQQTSETDAPHQGQYCIRLRCQLSQKPFVGVFFLLDGSWKPKRRYNLFEHLSANKGDAIKCRFWARAGVGMDKVYIQGKVGGVHMGEIHDSLVFPISGPWIALTPEWRMYEIDLSGQDISAMVSGFAWVCDRTHNGDKDVAFDLDTIYFVKTER